MIESYEYNKTHNPLNPNVVMATAASTVGLISVALLLTVYLSIILGGIAVVLALLSRGSDKKLLPQAKRGIIFGTIGMAIGYFLLVQAFVTFFTDPEARTIVNKYSEAISGQSLDDSLKELKDSFGITFE
ncbi:MAG: hypothetical protein E7301_01960 [Butyrivibrio sp.]|jgi:hypothetical protein|uniref:hypothetical protein n=1 Tax=Butyrivibrio sp. NC2002 TaxID=1410610 RepID=UPI000568D346|nr:hypothetical protein [Butyrivibrio sp. NC2002]MBE5858876.1 hypothetical protein [Butyrivibrio sp.]